MQRLVSNKLGYTDLATSLNISLIALHVGDMIEVDKSRGLVYQKLPLYRSLLEADLGAPRASVRRQLARPRLVTWNAIRGTFMREMP